MTYKFKFPPQMMKAARLTSAGKLTEATALIQRLLRGQDAPPSTPDKPTIIDAEYVELDEVGATSAQPEPSQSEPSQKTSPRSRMSLGETLRHLARTMPAGVDLKKGKVTRPAPPPLPDGASFEAMSYTAAAGTRTYKLYRPSRPIDERLPLIVMLHGCTQSPDDFAAGTGMNALAEQQGCFIAYPEQPSSANSHKCWNWFKLEDQQRDQGEPSLIAGITRQIMRDHPVDPNRVYIAGLSAGGAAAAIMGMAYPDLYAAVGVHSGLPAGSAADLPSALAAMRQGAVIKVKGARLVPTIVFHGDQDPTVHPRNGDAVVAQSIATATELRPVMEHGQVPGGHAYSRTIHADSAGRPWCEQWTIHGAGHAWAGGSSSGSYTDPQGPNATREMLRFFIEHSRP